MSRTFFKTLAATCAVLSTTALWATESTWDSSQTSWSLESGDTLTISSDATIDSTYSFTGSGTVDVTGGTLTLSYQPLTAGDPFRSFKGSLVLESGTSLTGDFTIHGEGKDGQANYNLGENMTLVMKGATVNRLSATSNGTNNGYLPMVEVESGTENTINNTRARSGNNNGIHLTFGKGIKGAGKLTVNSASRKVALAGDNSEFTGELVVSGGAGDGLWFSGTATGNAAASFTHTRSERIYFDHENGDSTTFELGALIATGDTTYLDVVKSGTTLKIGGRSGTNSEITAPFVSNAVTINKVGSSTSLTLGSAVEFVATSSLDVDEGTVILDGCDISGVTTDFASGTTLKVTSNGGTAAVGTAFGNLDLSDGALSIVADSSWTTGNTYNLFTVSGEVDGDVTTNVEVTGLTGNSYATVANDNGTIKATITQPTLTWNGTGTNWTDANAWTCGDATYTFKDGDVVTIPGNSTIALASDVVPGSVTVSGSVTLSGMGTITVDSFDGAGSLTVDSGEVRLDGTLNVPLAISSDATVALGTQTLTNVGKANVPYITGSGTLLVSNATVTVTHHEQSNLFTGFDGDVKFASGGLLEYLPLTSDGSTQESNSYPLGKGTLIFAGGALRGFSGTNARNNITLANAISVVADTYSAITNNAARSDGYCNFTLSGKFTGSGELEMWQGWKSSRSRTIAGDFSDFEGTIHLTEGANTYITSAMTDGAKANWDIGKTADRLVLQTPANGTVKFGGLTYTRNDANYTGFVVDYTGVTIEIGEANVSSVLNSAFKDSNCKDVTIVKKGTDTLTFDTGFAMKSADSTVIVSNGTLEVNCETALVAPVTVVAGATLTGTGKVSSVTFESGAIVDLGITSATSTESTITGLTLTSRPTLTDVTLANANVLSSGAWKLTAEESDGAYVLTATFDANSIAPGQSVTVTTATTEEEAKEAVTIVLTAEQVAAGQETGYFTKSVSGSSGNYTVSIVLDSTVVTPEINATEDEPFVVSSSGASFKVGNVKKGLWYFPVSSTDVAGTFAYASGDTATQATQTGESITLTATLDSTATVKFYRLGVDYVQPTAE